MIACFFSNISAKYYKNPSMLSRVIVKNVGDVFLDTLYIRGCAQWLKCNGTHLQFMTQSVPPSQIVTIC